MLRNRIVWIILACLTANLAFAAEHDFSTDPGWDAHGNRGLPAKLPVIRQSFGWRDSHHAGGTAKGEIGGRIQRSATIASYAVPIKPRTLNDKLHMTGRFSVTADEGSSGAMFGWFNESSRGWRTPNSLAMRIDGNADRGYIVFYEYGTQGYLTGGGGAFDGERYQTTKTPFFKPDGTQHTFVLDYDPEDADGRGSITFILDGDRRYEMPLLEGHKADSAVFNRFGIWNVQSTGGAIEVYYDDIEINGVPLELDAHSEWEARGNDISFQDSVLRPYQHFGFSSTNKAGGKATGEIGGIIWRDPAPAYYAGKTAKLTFDDALHASGTIAFHRQASDSGVWLGWFSSADKRSRTEAESKQPPNNFLGILVEGPSRIGHYFRPGYRTRGADGSITRTGPVIRPDGTSQKWTLRYDPKAADNRGRIDLTLGKETISLELRPGDRERGGSFDRFGLFNVQEGGHYVELYIDDLSYTASK